MAFDQLGWTVVKRGGPVKINFMIDFYSWGLVVRGVGVRWFDGLRLGGEEFCILTEILAHSITRLAMAVPVSF